MADERQDSNHSALVHINANFYSTVGVVFVSMLALALVIALLRAQALNRALALRLYMQSE
jgi:hypothetical protein